jgi:ribosomal protein S18 acetylase RimI-like enzyme
MQQLVNRSDAATWIAEEDGEMAGFAIVEWTEQPGGAEAYLQTIEVVRDRRGQGVGGELLRRVEGSASDADAGVLWLHVEAGNSGAIQMYEASGYLFEGGEENYYGPGRAALIYAKPLAPRQPSRGKGFCDRTPAGARSQGC